MIIAIYWTLDPPHMFKIKEYWGSDPLAERLAAATWKINTDPPPWAERVFAYMLVFRRECKDLPRWEAVEATNRKDT